MKYKNRGYWVLTVIFAGMMAFSSLLYLTHQPTIVHAFHQLGYPPYILNLLGTAKLIGVISLLQPRFPVLKEWAYAGFTINLVAASWSHLAVGQTLTAPIILILVLTGSYVFWKMMNRKPAAANSERISGYAL